MGALLRDEGMRIARLELDKLRKRFRPTLPVPFAVIDGLLKPGFAVEVAHFILSHAEDEMIARRFRAMNAFRRTQFNDYPHFPSPVRRLADALAAQDS